MAFTRERADRGLTAATTRSGRPTQDRGVPNSTFFYLSKLISYLTQSYVNSSYLTSSKMSSPSSRPAPGILIDLTALMRGHRGRRRRGCSAPGAPAPHAALQTPEPLRSSPLGAVECSHPPAPATLLPSPILQLPHRRRPAARRSRPSPPPAGRRRSALRLPSLLKTPPSLATGTTSLLVPPLPGSFAPYRL